MVADVTLYDGTVMETLEFQENALGIVFQRPAGIIIPGEEEAIKMTLIPWAAISKIDYTLTMDMVAQAQAEAMSEMSNGMNRKQRREMEQKLKAE